MFNQGVPPRLILNGRQALESSRPGDMLSMTANDPKQSLLNLAGIYALDPHWLVRPRPILVPSQA